MTLKVPEGFVLHPGKVRVASIEVVYTTPNFLVVEIDCHSKYADPVVSYGEEPEVYLFARPRTLGIDESTQEETWLELPRHTAGWQVLVDGGRYSVHVAAWRVPDHHLPKPAGLSDWSGAYVSMPGGWTGRTT